MLVRLSTIETPTSSRVRHLIGAVSKINDDTTFETTCLGLGSKNSFGRDMSLDVYRWRWRDPQSNNGVALVTPLNTYEVFERTNKPKECSLLRINYYMGGSYYDVLNSIGSKIFIVEEKLIVPNAERGHTGINNILSYKGLQHEVKETPKYEGDCNTRIELLDECKYEMYKLVKKVLVVSK
jgi:hypothetical protein